METDDNNDEQPNPAMRQLDVWANLVGTAIALAMAVIVYIRRRKLPVPDSFRKWIDPLKLTLDFLNGQEYAGPAIENAFQVDRAQLQQTQGLFPHKHKMSDPGEKLKMCGCPVPDTTCDCSKIRSCGCPKNSSPRREIGNLPPSLQANNRRTQTDTFLAVATKGQPCGFYRLTPYNPAGPKYRIRRKLGGGYVVTSSIDESGPAEGNYTIVSSTDQQLPGKYAVEILPNGGYQIRNTENESVANVEEGEYTFTAVFVVPTKSPEEEVVTPKSSLVIESKLEPDFNADISKDSKGSTSKQEEQNITGEINNESPPDDNKTNDAESKNISEVEIEQPSKTENDLCAAGIEPFLESVPCEKEEPLIPCAYFVQHTALPGMYKFNYCDTRPNKGPRPILDGVYPLWDRDTLGNSVPSNRPDGIYILEWVELDSAVDETNVHLPQPVAERIISVISETKPDGTNITTVTRKTAPVTGMALDYFYPGGLPPGLQPSIPPIALDVCGCSVTELIAQPQEHCVCAKLPHFTPEKPQDTNVEESENASKSMVSDPSADISKDTTFDTSCMCSKLKQLQNYQDSLEHTTQSSLPAHSVDYSTDAACLCASLVQNQISNDDSSCACRSQPSDRSADMSRTTGSISPNIERLSGSMAEQRNAYIEIGHSTDCSCSRVADTNAGNLQNSADASSLWKTLAEGTLSDTSVARSNACACSSDQNRSSIEQCRQAQEGGCICADADDSSFNPTIYHQIAPFKPKVAQTYTGCGQQQFDADVSSRVGATSTPVKSPTNRARYYANSGLQPSWVHQSTTDDDEEMPQTGLKTYMSQGVGPCSIGSNNSGRWPPASIRQPIAPECNRTNADTSELRSTKHLQSLKPNQVIQVQPGINILRRDDNNDVDVVVEMDIGAECLAEEGASKYNAAENAGNQTRNRY